MLKEVEQLKFLHEKIGISNKSLGEYCHCTSGTLGRYIRGDFQPTDQALWCIRTGIQHLIEDFREGMEM